MRIIILADPLDNQQAGIHYYTRNLVTHLAGIDEHGEYFILRRKKDDLFPSERQIVVKNHSFPGYSAWRMFVGIPRTLKKLQADVVVEPAHFGPFNLPKKMKRVTVVHDLTPILFPKLHRFHSQFLQKVFLKGIIRRASLIITNSANTSQDLTQYMPEAKQKTSQIYLGRDESMGFSANKSVVRKYTSGNPYILYAGTIEPRKNLNRLLEAFTIFKERSVSDHKLVIAGGKGWKSKSFYEALSGHPFKADIVLTGYIERDTLASLYSQAEAFVFPSLYEGFGLPVVEAMSCGTPCLLSNISSLPEVGGEGAIYFDPADPNEMADAMYRIVHEEGLRKQLSDKAGIQAAKFSWDNYAREFDREIKKLLKE